MFSVIFDMDGTLTDTQKIFVPAWDYAGGNQGFKNAGEKVEYVCGVNDEYCTNFILEHFKGIDIVKFKKDVADYINKNGVIALKPGVTEVLNFLKANKIKMAVASGSTIANINKNLNDVGVLNYFDAIASGDEVENSKPAPDVFLLAANRMGVNPKECIVFEDSSNGIKAGYAAGMKCIGVADVAPFDNEASEMAFKCFNTMDEAIELLKEYL